MQLWGKEFERANLVAAAVASSIFVVAAEVHVMSWNLPQRVSVMISCFLLSLGISVVVGIVLRQRHD